MGNRTMRWIGKQAASVALWVAGLCLLDLAYGSHPPITGWRFWLRIIAGLVIGQAMIVAWKAGAETWEPKQ